MYACAGANHTTLAFSLFGVQVDLTMNGLSKTDEVLRIIHQYIALLAKAGPDRWRRIFAEEAVRSLPRSGVAASSALAVPGGTDLLPRACAGPCLECTAHCFARRT